MIKIENAYFLQNIVVNLKMNDFPQLLLHFYIQYTFKLQFENVMI